MKRNKLLVWLIFWLALPASVLGRSIDLHGRALNDIKRADWSYRGEQRPDNWGRLSPAYSLCQNGSMQSPIDLIPAPPVRLVPLRFHYRTNPLRIRNDGLSIRLDFDAGSYLRVGNRAYELRELVFRTPSEHSVEGRPTDMEIQLLHRNNAGEYAVLSILVTAGIRRNAMLERIWDYLPMRHGSGHHYRQVGINPVFFIPPDHRYHRYEGSLSEPPCAEGVTWFVMQKPMEVSRILIDQLRRSMGENSRPVQAINGRSILTGR